MPQGFPRCNTQSPQPSPHGSAARCSASWPGGQRWAAGEKAVLRPERPAHKALCRTWQQTKGNGEQLGRRIEGRGRTKVHVTASAAVLGPARASWNTVVTLAPGAHASRPVGAWPVTLSSALLQALARQPQQPGAGASVRLLACAARAARCSAAGAGRARGAGGGAPWFAEHEQDRKVCRSSRCAPDLHIGGMQGCPSAASDMAKQRRSRPSARSRCLLSAHPLAASLGAAM